MEFKLIIKKLNNSLSRSEKEVFNAWYNDKIEHRNYFKNVKDNYANNITHIDVEKGWQQITAKIDAPKRRKIYWKYAAAILIFVSSGYFFLTKDNAEEKNTSIIAVDTNNVQIGTDKATLTLGDGTNVTLEKGQQFVSDNMESNGEEIIYKATNKPKQEIAYNYLTIPRGGQYTLKLSDGTEVWINSESQLKYPVNFIKGDTRKVELVYGEAYFEVTPSSVNNDSKFIVINQNQEVEVLGTEFNIKAYKDENFVYTTLVEGKVAVSNAISKQNLIPNQQSIINLENKNITINTVDVFIETSWRHGLFSFKSKPLKEIMIVLARWYDVEVEFANAELEKVKFHGVLSKNDKIEEVLEVIKNTKFINAYEIIDKKITIN